LNWKIKFKKEKKKVKKQEEIVGVVMCTTKRGVRKKGAHFKESEMVVKGA